MATTKRSVMGLGLGGGSLSMSYPKVVKPRDKGRVNMFNLLELIIKQG